MYCKKSIVSFYLKRLLIVHGPGGGHAYSKIPMCNIVFQGSLSRENQDVNTRYPGTGLPV